MTCPVKRHAPATERNREPILEVLRRVLPAQGTLLEIAAGTGEHAVFFASAFPGLRWVPSDPDAGARASIAAHAAEASLSNLKAVVALDASADEWPVEAAEAILCVNMIHISPLAATVGLFRGAARVLPSGGVLVTYGPYTIDGVHTAPSNEAFDASLRSRDPRWGVRDVAELEAVAAPHLALSERVAMPANNFTLVWTRA